MKNHVVLAAQHVDKATPVLKLSLVLTAILAAMCIGGGIVAIIWNRQSPSEIHILGMSVTTGDVGVAFVALGIIALIVAIRAVNRNIYRLAALPTDNVHLD